MQNHVIDQQRLIERLTTELGLQSQGNIAKVILIENLEAELEDTLEQLKQATETILSMQNARLETQGQPEEEE